MMWSKVDDKLHSHPKAQRAGEAMALWVMALSWCADHLTNGVVPADQPKRLLGGVGPRMAQKLVSVGLWEQHESGFRFHDYLDHNPDADEVRAKRAEVSSKRKEAGKRGAVARWQNGKPDSKPMANVAADAIADPEWQSGKSIAPSRTRPVPLPEEGGRFAPPARAPARETPPPSKTSPKEKEREQLVTALADGAGELWSNDGEPWRRTKLGAELEARGFDEDTARDFGRFLARGGVAESLKTSRFSPYWFVFGGSPQGAEFRHLDAAEGAFDAWCEEQRKRADEQKRQREKREAAEQRKAKALSPEQLAARTAEFKSHLAKVKAESRKPSEALLDGIGTLHVGPHIRARWCAAVDAALDQAGFGSLGHIEEFGRFLARDDVRRQLLSAERAYHTADLVRRAIGTAPASPNILLFVAAARIWNRECESKLRVYFGDATRDDAATAVAE